VTLLSQLLVDLEMVELSGDPNIKINGLHYDSRQIRPGFLFAAITGFQTDGHLYIPSALNNGASVLLAEKPVEVPSEVTVVRVADSRRALAKLAAAYYKYPSSKLRVVGVTGTNGKTTTTHLIEAILNKAGYQTGLLGTIANRIGGKEWPVVHTTPESLDLQALLGEMVSFGSDYAIMEVSSHALALDRVANCQFDVAVFTNLSQDHLDFHQNMDDYRDTKLRLFSGLGKDNHKPGPRYAVVNADDAAGERFIKATPVEVITYGLEKPAQVRADSIEITPCGTSFRAVLPDGELAVKLNMTGHFSIYNALAALTVAWREGINYQTIQSALRAVRGVPGRFELIDSGQDFTVVVDYAHTPDGLENVLSTAREVANGQVITVFGCGGDRDRTKRPRMGEVVARLSDYAVVTSDNPRTEDPMRIIEDILPGIRAVGAKQFTVIPDRRQAIQQALQIAKPGDMVVIAGKGHETYQLVGTEVLPFDDRAVAKEILGQIAGNLK
jgi:UDP-N-acetylmuramoyl-L-alanyl-D-glutamate--2,6-diaminopimelate ligase